MPSSAAETLRVASPLFMSRIAADEPPPVAGCFFVQTSQSGSWQPFPCPQLGTSVVSSLRAQSRPESPTQVACTSSTALLLMIGQALSSATLSRRSIPRTRGADVMHHAEKCVFHSVAFISHATLSVSQ
jgi:hypothetical protein